MANDLAAALDASIDVLHVFDLPDGVSMASEGYVPLPDNYRQAVERQATERLKDWLPTTSAPASASHTSRRASRPSRSSATLLTTAQT